jgi:hypothetical protein
LGSGSPKKDHEAEVAAGTWLAWGRLRRLRERNEASDEQ